MIPSPIMDPITIPAIAPPLSEVEEVATAGYDTALAIVVVFVDFEDALDNEVAAELSETEFALELVMVPELVVLPELVLLLGVTMLGSPEMTVICSVEVISVSILARTATV